MTEVYPPQGQWVYVAAVFDRDNDVHLFLNGEHQASRPRPSKAGGTGPAWVSIGSLGSGEQRWRGRLAHVAVYPHVLDPQQIKSHWRKGATQESLPAGRKEGSHDLDVSK